MMTPNPNSMKLKALYIVSLLVLGVFVVLPFFHPTVSETAYSEVSRMQLLENGTERIILFDIVNHEQKDMNYTVTVTVDGKNDTEEVLLREGGVFTYAHHIHPERTAGGEISFAVYKEGMSAPIEEATYFGR